MKRKILMSVVVCLFILGTCMGAVREISVSNTVNGRELPIYSVETEAKQVALSSVSYTHLKWDSCDERNRIFTIFKW